MKKLIKRVLLEQTNESLIIPASDYIAMLDEYDNLTQYVHKLLTKNPEDKGKKITIQGNLKLSNRDIEVIYGIDKILGNLDISNTNISNLGNIVVSGNVSDYGSPRQMIRIKRERQKKLNDAQSRRENNEWDLDNPDIDDVGIYANAAFDYFINENNDVKIKTPEDIEKLSQLHAKMEQLLEKEKEYENDGKDLTDVFAEIEVTEDEINELNDAIDIYNFIPEGSHYELTRFVIISNDEYNDWEVAVGTRGEAEDSLKSYFEEYVDNPVEYLGRDRLKYYIDEEAVAEYAREFYDMDVRDSLESYFDSDDYELSEEDQERLDDLNAELDEYRERLEMYPDDSAEYEQIQDHIDDLENQIEKIEDSKEISEKQIEDKIDDLVSDVENNPEYFMQDFGLDVENYIDKDKLLDSLVDESDFGTLNGWDSTYDEVNVLGEYYVVMIINH